MSDKKRYMLTIVSILILVIGVTFAYLAARVSDGTLSKLNLSADNVDDFKFSVDKDIALTATQFNLTSGGGNLSDETIVTASLKANGTKKTATYNYYVYFAIKSNGFTYTTEDKKPEIILTVTGPNGEITQIEGLTYYDGTTTNGVKGFDITSESSTYAIAENQEITSNSNTNYTNHEYTFKVTFINLDTNQVDNQGKTLTAEAIIQKDELVYAIGDVDNSGALSSSDSLKILQYLSGNTTLSKWQKKAADVNQDGIIDKIDSTLIMGTITGKYKLPYTTSTVHRITYDLDGGTPIGILTEQYAEGIGMSIESTLAPKGEYVFIGWTRTDTDTPSLSYRLGTSLTEDITLKANWRLLGDVTQDGEITVGDAQYIKNYINGSVDFTQQEINLADINQDGYVDYFDSDLLLKYSVGAIEKIPYDNSNAYKITYDLNGGTESKRNQEYFIDNFTLSDPVRNGYTFIGWTGSNGNIPRKRVNINYIDTLGDLHFKANWQKNS